MGALSGGVIINEHDGYIILYRVDLAARAAGENITILLIDKLAVAFRTTEYFEKFFGKHECSEAMLAQLVNLFEKERRRTDGFARRCIKKCVDRISLGKELVCFLIGQFVFDTDTRLGHFVDHDFDIEKIIEPCGLLIACERLDDGEKILPPFNLRVRESELAKKIRAALLEHKVIFFPGAEWSDSGRFDLSGAGSGIGVVPGGNR